MWLTACPGGIEMDRKGLLLLAKKVTENVGQYPSGRLTVFHCKWEKEGWKSKESPGFFLKGTIFKVIGMMSNYELLA